VPAHIRQKYFKYLLNAHSYPHTSFHITFSIHIRMHTISLNLQIFYVNKVIHEEIIDGWRDNNTKKKVNETVLFVFLFVIL